MSMSAGMIFKTDENLNIILWDTNGYSGRQCNEFIKFLNKFKENYEESGNILGKPYSENLPYTIENYKLEPNKKYKIKFRNYVTGSVYLGCGTICYELIELLN